MCSYELLFRILKITQRLTVTESHVEMILKNTETLHVEIRQKLQKEIKQEKYVNILKI